MRVVYTLPHHLEVKRLEKFLDRRLLREAVRSHDLIVPLSLRAASRLVEPDSLGVIVVDLSLAHGHDRAAARLVTWVVVQANLAEGRETHLVFMNGSSLITAEGNLPWPERTTRKKTYINRVTEIRIFRRDDPLDIHNLVSVIFSHGVLL